CEFQAWRQRVNPVIDEKPRGFVDAHLAAGRAAVLQPGYDALVRALVLLPDANVVAAPDQLAGAHLLEPREHPHRLAFGRQYDREGTLALAPPDTGQIQHGRPRLQ